MRPAWRARALARPALVARARGWRCGSPRAAGGVGHRERPVSAAAGFGLLDAGEQPAGRAVDGFGRFQASSSALGSARRPRATRPRKRTLAQWRSPSVDDLEHVGVERRRPRSATWRRPRLEVARDLGEASRASSRRRARRGRRCRRPPARARTAAGLPRNGSTSNPGGNPGRRHRRGRRGIGLAARAAQHRRRCAHRDS